LAQNAKPEAVLELAAAELLLDEGELEDEDKLEDELETELT
jgi:hypothetical protein